MQPRYIRELWKCYYIPRTTAESTYTATTACSVSCSELYGFILLASSLSRVSNLRSFSTSNRSNCTPSFVESWWITSTRSPTSESELFINSVHREANLVVNDDSSDVSASPEIITLALLGERCKSEINKIITSNLQEYIEADRSHITVAARTASIPLSINSYK